MYHTLWLLSTTASTYYALTPQDIGGHCSIAVILKLESIESCISHGSRRVPRLPTAVFRFNSHVKKERCLFPRKNPCFCSIYSITTLRYDGHRQKLDVPPLITPGTVEYFTSIANKSSKRTTHRQGEGMFKKVRPARPQPF